MTSRFPLFSLPPLCCKNVFELMKLIDLLELSFASRKLKRLIKSYCITATHLKFNLRSLQLKIASQELFLNFNSSVDKCSGTRMIGNSEFKMWTKKPEENEISCIPPNFNEAIIVAFHYLAELFFIKELHYDISGFSAPFIENMMEHLPNQIWQLTMGDSDNAQAAEDAIREILSHYNVKSTIVLSNAVAEIHEKLTCEHVVIQNGMAPSIAKSLIEHWKENQTNLRSLRMKLVDASDNIISTILAEMDARPWDPKRRDSICRMSGKEFNCETFMDIERNCDGLLASVGLNGSWLEFVVWERRFPIRCRWSNLALVAAP